MIWLKAIVRETFGLFVDDAAFALAIMVCLVAALAVAHWAPGAGWGGPALFAALAAILAASAVRYAGGRRG
jgi:hypothetical protein